MARAQALSRSALHARQPRKGLMARIAGFSALARQRRALAALDDGQLADLGLSRQEAEIEAARPAWDVPSHWQG